MAKQMKRARKTVRRAILVQRAVAPIDNNQQKFDEANIEDQLPASARASVLNLNMSKTM